MPKGNYKVASDEHYENMLADGIFDDEADDWLAAVQQFKREREIKFMRHTHYLVVAKRLGYVRPGKMEAVIKKTMSLEVEN